MASRYQLRRTGHSIRNVHPSLELISLDQDCVKFGRNPDVVSIVLHSSVYANMISREHAEIRRSRLQDGTVAYHLYDRSLNGTYVNDYRVDGQILLHPGDVIQFGHINGAAIQPGQQAPQPDAEFTYIFEKVPRALTQPQSLDAKMAATLFGAGPSTAGGRLSGTPTQWPHPYAALGASPHSAYFAAAGFNPYLSQMAPLLPTQSGPGASFVQSYGGALSQTAGMMQNTVRQQDLGNAPWFGMTAAHQSPSAAGMVHHYHNQSPVSATIPTTASAAAVSFYHQQQQQPNAIASAPTPANQMPSTIRATPEQQQIHNQQQQHHLLNELESRLAGGQQQQQVGAGQQPQHMSCAVGHESASIVTSLAGSNVMTSRSLDTSSMNNFPSRTSLPISSERNVQQDRFVAGVSQLNNASTYQSVQSQTDVRRPQHVSEALSASQKQQNHHYVVGGSPSSSIANRNSAAVQEGQNTYGPAVALASSDAGNSSPSVVVVSTSSGRQQRDTVVVETPVRTLADTSTTASSDFEGVTARLPSSHTQPPVGTNPTEDKKVECDSSVPSPPEDPIRRRRSIESNRDQEEESQNLNRDLFKLASAAQSRCLNNDDAQEDVFELAAPSRTNEDRTERSSSSGSHNDSPPPKRSPSPLRTALLSNKTSTNSGGVSNHQRLSGGGSSSSAGSVKRRRKTNEVARLLTDLSDSSFMFEVRKKEEAQMKQKVGGKKPSKRSESSTGDDESSKNDDDDIKIDSSEHSSFDDDNDEDLRSKLKSAKTVEKGTKSNIKREQNSNKSQDVESTRKRRKGRNRGRKNSEMSSYNSDESSSHDDNDNESIKSCSSNGSFRRPTSKHMSKTRQSSSKHIAPAVQRRLNLKPPTRTSSSPRNKNSKNFANDVYSDDDDDDEENDEDDEVSSKRSRKSIGRSSSRQRKVQKRPTSSRAGKNKDDLSDEDADEDVAWNYHDPTQECAAAKNCVKPTDAEVQWVQCDDCTAWYHMPCAGCEYEEVKEDDAAFHCGCA